MLVSTLYFGKDHPVRILKASISSRECTWRLFDMLQIHAEWATRTLRQTCCWENPTAQCAFKILMIHEVLQFALRIAFRCVLHRCGNLDIHRWKLCILSFVTTCFVALSFIFAVLGSLLIHRKSRDHGPCPNRQLIMHTVGIWQSSRRRQQPTNEPTYSQSQKIMDRCGNDPSAGSPTETLLRLHLPLNDKV